MSWLIKGRRWKTAAVVCLSLLILGLCTYCGLVLYAEHHLQAAQTHLNDDRFDQAEASLRKALRFWPNSGRARLLAAQLARRTDRYEDAEEELRRCRNVLGNVEAVQLEEMLLSIQRGDVPRTTEDVAWGMIERRHERRFELLEALSKGYMLTFQLKSAVRSLTSWIDDRPDDVRALFWRGWVQERLHYRDAAERDYRLVLKLESDHDDCRSRLAHLLIDANRYRDALPLLEELRRSQPEDPAAAIGLALSWDGLGDQSQARTLLREVVKDHPTSIRARRELGKLANLAGDLKEAREVLETAYREAPQDAEVLVNWLEYLKKAKRHDEAARVQKELDVLQSRLKRLNQLVTSSMQSAPRDPDLMSEIGALYLDAGRAEWYDWGLWWIGRALDLDAGHAASHAALARHNERLGKSEAAERHRQAAAQRFMGNDTTSPRAAER